MTPQIIRERYTVILTTMIAAGLMFGYNIYLILFPICRMHSISSIRTESAYGRMNKAVSLPVFRRADKEMYADKKKFQEEYGTYR